MPLEKRRFSPTKRRSQDEKCTPSLRLADLCEEHRENHDQHQASAGPPYRRGVARSPATGESPFGICDWRRHPNRRDQCSDLFGRSLHDRRSPSATHPRLSGAECAVLQGFHTACRPEETSAPSHWDVRRTFFGKHVSQLGTDSPGRLGQAFCLGFDCAYLRNSWHPGVGGLVRGRTEFTSCVDSRARYWM